MAGVVGQSLLNSWRVRPNLSDYAGLVISELMYHPGPVSAEEAEAGFGAQDFEFIELHNGSEAVMDLSPLRFTKGVDFEFATAGITSLAPEASVLVVADAQAFALRYGDGLPVAGVYQGQLANGGERLKLSFGAGEGLIDFSYDDGEGWPSEADGGGQSLILAALGDGEDLSQAAAWALGGLRGSPGLVSEDPQVLVARPIPIETG